jgi:hypothetical protein
MNPGAVEETSKAVGGFFDIMRGSPMALALVVMNFALLGYLFWSGKETLSMAYKAQNSTQLLLDKCIDKGAKA